MFRCVASSSSRLATSLYKQPSKRSFLLNTTTTTTAIKSRFSQLITTTTRRSFTTNQAWKQALKEKPVTNAVKEAEIKAKEKGNVKQLFELAKPEMKSISAATGLLVISSAVTMSIPFSMGKIIDIVTHPDMDTYMGLTMPEFAGALSLVFVVGAAANTGRVLLFRIAGERIIQNLRMNLYKSILRQDMSFFDKNRTGELISRLSTDTAIVGKSLTNNVSDGLRALATAAVGSSMMLAVSPKLTGIMMLIVPPVAFFAIIYGRYVKSLSRKTQTALSEITKVAEERISSIRTVQAFAKEKTEEKRYGLRVLDVFALAKTEALASGAFFGGAGLSGNLAVLAVLWYGGKMVMDNTITIGELTSFMLYSAYVGTSLGGMTSFYSEIMKGVGASDRIFDLLKRDTPIKLESGVIMDQVKGKVQFDNVTFSYPTRPQSQIFRKFSLAVEPGTVIAIVGPSGSGKSTIGSLLLRYYDSLSGDIFIDDKNIKDINLHWWREQVGVVSQEPTLFAGTIAENIAYGRENATIEEIQAAAVGANCANFINSFADKYNTLVGERGVSLSGGQKQRIAIARALLKDPKILILDEATSALDSESEVLVQDALNRLMQGRTVFTIAHRLSTIRSADLVACLSDGAVAELGTYDELLDRKDGVFRKLVELQSLGGQKEIEESFEKIN